jgi:hypothetical protein
MNPANPKVALEHRLGRRAGFADRSGPKGKTFGDLHSLLGTPREQRATEVAMALTETPVNEPGISPCSWRPTRATHLRPATPPLGP